MNEVTLNFTDMYKIEGIATISKGRFSFDSGLPGNEPAVEAQSMLGRLHIAENACAEFSQDGRTTNLPPNVVSVCETDGYRLKRTSRNYILQVKIPLTESRAETEKRLGELLAAVLGEITLDRSELYGRIVA